MVFLNARAHNKLKRVRKKRKFNPLPNDEGKIEPDQPLNVTALQYFNADPDIYFFRKERLLLVKI